MNQFVRVTGVLLAVALLASATTAQAQTYYFWQLDSPNSGDYLSASNWSPTDIPDAAGEVAVINRSGEVQITSGVGTSFGGPDEIWVGDGSITSTTPGEGHVRQTAGDVYIGEQFRVGRSNAPGSSTYTMEGGSLTLLDSNGTDVWGFRIGSTCKGTMSVTGTNPAAPTTVTVYDLALIGQAANGDGLLEMSGYSAATFDSGLWIGYSGADGAPAHGVVNLSGHANVTVNSGGSIGCWNYSHGELHLSGNASFAANGWFNVGDVGSGEPGRGEVTVSDDATFQTVDLRVGAYGSGRGTVTLSSTTGHTATWNAGWFGVGLWGGTGEIILRDGGVVNLNNWISLAEANSNGTFTMEGGQFNLTVDNMGMSIGYYHNASSNWNQSGGVLNSLSPMEVGRYGGVGTARFTGTAQATLPSIRVGVNWGDNSADVGVGNVIVDDNAQVTVTGVGTYGNSYANTITLSHGGGNGAWTQNGGTTTCANPVVVAEYDYWDTADQSPGVGRLNLNGGLFACPGMLVRADSGVVAGTSGTVNFNGGTLRATAASTSFFTVEDAGATPTSTLTLNVQSGGAVIDTNGFAVTIANPLVEDAGSTGGGLTKLGAGTLSLTSTAHTYTGDTHVEGGVLSTADSTMLDDLASLWIDTGAQMDLLFSGTDTIGGLYLGGVAQTTEGTWGALGSGAQYTSSFFTGTGLVLLDIAVPPVPIPGDANGDKKVDTADANRLAQYWGATTKDPNYTWWEMGDFNGDNTVNAADASILAANWGDHTGGEGGPLSVPEPTVLALVIGLGLAIASRRPRR